VGGENDEFGLVVAEYSSHWMFPERLSSRSRLAQVLSAIMGNDSRRRRRFPVARFSGAGAVNCGYHRWTDDLAAGGRGGDQGEGLEERRGRISWEERRGES